MTDHRSNLVQQLESAQISLAMKGQLDHYLSPHLWERLRQRLQYMYRMATGESMATLSIDTPTGQEDGP